MTRRTKRLLLLFGAVLALAAVCYGVLCRGPALWARDLPVDRATNAPPVEPVVPADIMNLFDKGEIHNAVLLNNFEGRMMNPETKKLKGDLAGLGKPVDPGDVMIISDASVPDEMVELYTSITRLPDSAEVVRILYTRSADRKKATLLGYTVERPKGTDVAFVRYDGSTPWLEWITKSFPAIDAKPDSRPSPPKMPQ